MEKLQAVSRLENDNLWSPNSRFNVIFSSLSYGDRTVTSVLLILNTGVRTVRSLGQFTIRAVVVEGVAVIDGVVVVDGVFVVEGVVVVDNVVVVDGDVVVDGVVVIEGVVVVEAVVVVLEAAKVVRRVLDDRLVLFILEADAVVGAGSVFGVGIGIGIGIGIGLFAFVEAFGVIEERLTGVLSSADCVLFKGCFSIARFVLTVKVVPLLVVVVKLCE